MVYVEYISYVVHLVCEHTTCRVNIIDVKKLSLYLSMVNTHTAIP